jgi:outer membrane lipase/esterase
MFALLRFVSSSASRLACILAASLVISACGSGSTFEPLVPTRVVSFGDGLSDVGQTGAKFTVNDGTVNIWAQQVAARYGQTLTAAVSGGLGFAQGGARIGTGANSITDQIGTFLAGNTVGARDLLIIDAGVAELAALAQANPTDAAFAAAARVAGQTLATQVLRLTAAGVKHVVIANAPDMGKTPLAATAPSRTAGFSAATRAFNDGLKEALGNVTTGVLLVDNEAYVNSLFNNPALLGAGANVTAPACTGLVTACTNTANVVANYAVYLFADDRHLAPAAHRLIGDNAYNNIRNRW